MRTTLKGQIGKRIRLKREEAGLTREKFAETVDISPQFLADIENGNKGLSNATLYKICEGLSASADYILMGRENKSDVSAITEMLSNLDEKYLPYAEDMLRAFISAVGSSRIKNIR